MKIRRVVLEVEVPWEFHHLALQEVVRVALNDTHLGAVHQEQVLSFEVSHNTQIGATETWPPIK